jgi:hypothetical protein
VAGKILSLDYDDRGNLYLKALAELRADSLIEASSLSR